MEADSPLAYEAQQGRIDEAELKMWVQAPSVFKFPFLIPRNTLIKHLNVAFPGSVFASTANRSHDHPGLHISRHLLEDAMIRKGKSAGIQSFADVGGCVHRHAQLLRGNVHSLRPVLGPDDAVRSRFDLQHGSANMCRHKLHECEHVSLMDALLFTHSLYYVSPAEVLQALHKCRKGIAFALVHEFADAVGELPPGAPEARYVVDENDTVTMTTRSGTYVHPNLRWLVRGHYNDGRTGMSWSKVIVTHCSSVYCFTTDVVRPMAPLPTPRLLDLTSVDCPTGMIDIRALPVRQSDVPMSRLRTLWLDLDVHHAIVGPSNLSMFAGTKRVVAPRQFFGLVALRTLHRDRTSGVVGAATEAAKREIARFNISPDDAHVTIRAAVGYAFALTVGAEVSTMEAVDKHLNPLGARLRKLLHTVDPMSGLGDRHHDLLKNLGKWPVIPALPWRVMAVIFALIIAVATGAVRPASVSQHLEAAAREAAAGISPAVTQCWLVVHDYMSLATAYIAAWYLAMHEAACGIVSSGAMRAWLACPCSWLSWIVGECSLTIGFLTVDWPWPARDYIYRASCQYLAVGCPEAWYVAAWRQLETAVHEWAFPTPQPSLAGPLCVALALLVLAGLAAANWPVPLPHRHLDAAFYGPHYGTDDRVHVGQVPTEHYHSNLPVPGPAERAPDAIISPPDLGDVKDPTALPGDANMLVGVGYLGRVPERFAQSAAHQELGLAARQALPMVGVRDAQLAYTSWARQHARVWFGPRSPVPDYEVLYDIWVGRFPLTQRLAYKEARRALDNGECLLEDILKRSTFVKGELEEERNDDGDKTKPPRIIMGATAQLNVLIGPFMYWMAGKMKNTTHRRGHPTTWASGLTSDQIGAWFSAATEGGAWRAVEIDASKWDASVDGPLLDVEADICADYRSDENRLPGGFVFSQVLRAMHVKCGVTHGGVYFRIRWTRASGDAHTSLFNGFHNMAIALYAYCDTHHVLPYAVASRRLLPGQHWNDEPVRESKRGDSPEGGLEFSGIYNGDDHLTVGPDDGSVAVAISSVPFDDYYRRIGFRPKAHVRTRECDVEFCSALFWPIAPYQAPSGDTVSHKLGPKPGRLLPKLGWCSADPNAMFRYLLRMGADQPARTQKWTSIARGKALGLQRECWHVPFLNEHIARVLDLTADVKAVAITQEHKFHSDHESEWDPPRTLQFLDERYGLGQADIDAHSALVADAGIGDLIGCSELLDRLMVDRAAGYLTAMFAAIVLAAAGMWPYFLLPAVTARTVVYVVWSPIVEELARRVIPQLSPVLGFAEFLMALAARPAGTHIGHILMIRALPTAMHLLVFPALPLAWAIAAHAMYNAVALAGAASSISCMATTLVAAAKANCLFEICFVPMSSKRIRNVSRRRSASASTRTTRSGEQYGRRRIAGVPRGTSDAVPLRQSTTGPFWTTEDFGVRVPGRALDNRIGAAIQSKLSPLTAMVASNKQAKIAASAHQKVADYKRNHGVPPPNTDRAREYMKFLDRDRAAWDASLRAYNTARGPGSAASGRAAAAHDLRTTKAAGAPPSTREAPVTMATVAAPAPASPGTGFAVRQATGAAGVVTRFEAKTTKTGAFVSGVDYLTTLTWASTDIVGQPKMVLAVNPRALTGRLAAVAGTYERFWFRKFTVHWAPAKAMTVGGALLGWFDSNPLDSIPPGTSAKKQMGWGHSGDIALPFAKQEWHMNVVAKPPLYIDPTGDQLLTNQASFALIVDQIIGDTAYVDMFITYECDLYDSTYDANSIIPNALSYYNAAATTASIMPTTDFDGSITTGNTIGPNSNVAVRCIVANRLDVPLGPGNFVAFTGMLSAATSVAAMSLAVTSRDAAGNSIGVHTAAYTWPSVSMISSDTKTGIVSQVWYRDPVKDPTGACVWLCFSLNATLTGAATASIGISYVPSDDSTVPTVGVTVPFNPDQPAARALSTTQRLVASARATRYRPADADDTTAAPRPSARFSDQIRRDYSDLDAKHHASPERTAETGSTHDSDADDDVDQIAALLARRRRRSSFNLEHKEKKTNINTVASSSLASPLAASSARPLVTPQVGARGVS
jgi:hypothetical protein